MIKILKINKGFRLSINEQNRKNNFLLSHLKRNATETSENNFDVINDDPQKLLNMISFFISLNLEHEIENEIKRILDALQQQRIMLEQNRDDALETKQSNQDKIPIITIPGFLPQHKLTTFQNRVVRHGEIIQNVANFSVPGSGKTWMAYANYFLLKNQPEPNNVEKLLVICPKSAYKTWETEFKLITGEGIEKFKRIVGDKDDRTYIFEKGTQYEIFLINYDAVRRDSELIQNFISQNRFLVILDESHHIKDPKSETWMAIREFASFAFRRMILTGTPLPNKFEDIWTQFEFLNPTQNILGAYEQFERRVQNPDEYRRIYENINPYWMRIGLSDLGLKLPEPKYIHCPMGIHQTRIYRIIANDMLSRGIPTFTQDRNSNVANIEAYCMYLLEATTDPSLLTEDNQYNPEIFDADGVPLDDILNDYKKYETSGKLTALKELIKEAMEKTPPEKLLIWCSFRGTIKKVRDMAQDLGYNADIIYGDVPQSDEEDPTNNREKIIETFKFKNDHNILIANPASISESVSLHKECHHAIYVDRTYVAANWIQSKFRIFRYGLTEMQAKDTRIDVLYTPLTIDQDIRDNLEFKETQLMNMLNENNIGVTGLDIDYNNFTDTTDRKLEMYNRIIKRIREYLNDNV